jgi:cell wall-associated NlpC family hydrolase
MKYPSYAHYDSAGLTWKPLDFEGSDKVTQKIEKICALWDHTPYISGQQSPGEKGGVDCVRFVCAVLDACYGVDHNIPRQVQDRALHDPEGAQAVVTMIREYYPDHKDLPDGDREVEPGDIIVTGHSQGGPGHAILVGARKNTLWQAMTRRVRMGGLGLLRHYQQIFVIIRPDKTLWLD